MKPRALQTTECTVASGELAIVVHDGPAAQGSQNFTLTATPHNVVAVDSEGNEYSVRGAPVRRTLNVNTGGEQATFTSKLQIVAPGQGTVDGVNLTLHVTAQPNNFVLEEFDFGSCEDPG